MLSSNWDENENWGYTSLSQNELILVYPIFSMPGGGHGKTFFETRSVYVTLAGMELIM